MNESILTSTKKVLGIAELDTSFDEDIIMHINTVFSHLLQMGVGTTGFVLTDKNQQWTAFLNKVDCEELKTYVYLKVRLIFDPPASATVLKAFEESAKEMEWRLYTKLQNDGGGY